MGDRFFKAMDVHRPLATLKTRLETDAAQHSSERTAWPSNEAIRAAAHASLADAGAQQRS